MSAERSTTAQHTSSFVEDFESEYPGTMSDICFGRETSALISPVEASWHGRCLTASQITVQRSLRLEHPTQRQVTLTYNNHNERSSPSHVQTLCQRPRTQTDHPLSICQHQCPSRQFTTRKKIHEHRLLGLIRCSGQPRWLRRKWDPELYIVPRLT
jgi:hypothetical protein